MIKKNLTMLLLIAGAFVASCDFNNVDTELNESPDAITGEIDMGENSVLNTECDLEGPSTITTLATSGIYTMTTNLSNATFFWEVVSGSAIIACPTCATTQISFPAGTGIVKIKCTVTNGVDGCYEQITINRGTGGGGAVCTCPTPVITIFDPWPSDPNKNCNTTSTGLYSFTLTGTAPGDAISWSGNSNVNVQNGQGTTAMAAYIYNTSADFIVTCTVTRNCGNGIVYVRTATYGSNISQQCQYYQKSTSGDCGLILD